MDIWVRCSVIASEDRLKYQLLIAQSNCLLLRKCIEMVKSALCCAECGTELCPVGATMAEFTKALSSLCSVDHCPASSVVHRAVCLAMERNLTINPHAVCKMLYTDARLTCNAPICDAGNNCRYGEVDEQAIALLDSITIQQLD